MYLILSDFCSYFSYADNESSDWVNTSQSQAKRFQDFLLRANKYPSLSVLSGNSTMKKIILVEVGLLN